MKPSRQAWLSWGGGGKGFAKGLGRTTQQLAKPANPMLKRSVRSAGR